MKPERLTRTGIRCRVVPLASLPAFPPPPPPPPTDRVTPEEENILWNIPPTLNHKSSDTSR